jgi:hypothetical protein
VKLKPTKVVGNTYVNVKASRFCVFQIDGVKDCKIDQIKQFESGIIIEYSYSTPSRKPDGSLYFNLFGNSIRVDKDKFESIKIEYIKDVIHMYNSRLGRKK